MNLMAALMPEKKRRRGRPQVPGPARINVVGLKGTPEWKTWLDEFSEFCGLCSADTIGQSLICSARERGFRLPPVC